MIAVTHEGAVATITFNRPDRRNALTPEMLDALPSLVTDAASSARAVVLTGAGKAFCAGFDLPLCKADPSGAVMKRLLAGLSAAIQAMRSAPVPVVVAAHGAAIAGGCALLGGADLAITNDDAVLGYPVARLGVSPAVSAPFLRQAVGDGTARELMLDSGLISGREALRLGLVHVSTPRPEDVLTRARERAADLASKPPEALAATKAWLNEITSPGSTAEAALRASMSLAGGAEERARLAALGGSPGVRHPGGAQTP